MKIALPDAARGEAFARMAKRAAFNESCANAHKLLDLPWVMISELPPICILMAV
jgi:hypothetical protein